MRKVIGPSVHRAICSSAHRVIDYISEPLIPKSLLLSVNQSPKSLNRPMNR
jgi:hypothetical protein